MFEHLLDYMSYPYDQLPQSGERRHHKPYMFITSQYSRSMHYDQKLLVIQHPDQFVTLVTFEYVRGQNPYHTISGKLLDFLTDVPKTPGEPVRFSIHPLLNKIASINKWRATSETFAVKDIHEFVNALKENASYVNVLPLAHFTDIQPKTFAEFVSHYDVQDGQIHYLDAYLTYRHAFIVHHIFKGELMYHYAR